MNRLMGGWFLLGMVALLEAKAPNEELKIQVLVYNYAGIASETLAQAEREAARIYNRAGIRTQWLDCPLAPDQAERYPACQLRVSPARLVLRVLSPRMADRLGLSETVLGSAHVAEDGGYGMIAEVCAHCVEDLAKERRVAFGVILGDLIAHELGHLLLGIGSHSRTGLMHAFWYKKELDRIAEGSLLFTPRENDKMRDRVLARSQLQK